MASWFAASGIPLRISGVQYGSPSPACQLWAMSRALGQWITMVSENSLKVGYKMCWGCSIAGQNRLSTAVVSTRIANKRSPNLEDIV